MTTSGVGVLFNPTLVDFLSKNASSMDYLSVIPDRCWIDQGVGAGERFKKLPKVYDVIREASETLPLVIHSIGMSICSADLFDEEYVDYLADWRMQNDCLWASDHLSFSRGGSGHETNAAVALPVPYDLEMLELILPRVRTVKDRLNCPFLLENNVYYFEYCNEEMSETDFLNQLTSQAGCNLLLDLHSVYTNSVNHKFDPYHFIEALDLSDRELFRAWPFTGSTKFRCRTWAQLSRQPVVQGFIQSVTDRWFGTKRVREFLVDRSVWDQNLT